MDVAEAWKDPTLAFESIWRRLAPLLVLVYQALGLVCLQAVREAATQAREALADVLPIFALEVTDVVWQMLFEGHESAEVEAIREVLGDQVQITGGYINEQIASFGTGQRPEFLNQQIEIVLFG